MLMIASLGLSGQKKVAKKMLDNITDKYDQFESIDITFDLTLTYPERRSQNQQAHIVQKGNKFVFTSEEQDIYGDGEDVYLYLKERNEVQINDFDADDELGLMTPKDLLKQYRTDKFEYDLEQKTNTHLYIVFKPLDKESEYSKYRISIDKKKEDFETIEAYGKDGSHITVKIATSVFNKSYASNYFTFDTNKYPDVIVEDLRID